MQIFFIFGAGWKEKYGRRGRHEERKALGASAIWAILLMLLLGGAVWAYQAFSVADWQSLYPSRLTSLAQTGAIHDKNGDYVTSLVGKENRTVIDTVASARARRKCVPCRGGFALLQASGL